MKKISISISYDEERIKALNLYLEQRDIRLEEELTKALDGLYIKTVPANVRAFIDLKSGTASPLPKKKTKDPSAVVEQGLVPNVDGDHD